MHYLFHALLPKKLISSLMYKISRIENKAFKNIAIRLFMKITGANLDHYARKSVDQYQSLLDFFTRELADNARQIQSGSHNITSPVDGTIAHIGHIENQQIFQIKGYTYSLCDLISNEYAGHYKNAQASTIYLAPYNYHRIHMPMNGKLLRAKYIPGELNSVSINLLDKISGLFAKNERVVLEFIDDTQKQFIIVLVGAVNVGSIETVLHGQITPSQYLSPIDLNCNGQSFKQGEEIGRFNLGSTVILIIEQGCSTWQNNLVAGNSVQLGELIGTTHD